MEQSVVLYLLHLRSEKMTAATYLAQGKPRFSLLLFGEYIAYDE